MSLLTLNLKRSAKKGDTFWCIAMKLFLKACVLITLLNICNVFGSQYDPHLYPSNGPFMEGWYTRLTDTENGRSFGVLFGRVLKRSNQSTSPSSSSPSDAPTTYIGLLRSDGRNAPMIVAEAYPAEKDITVTVRDGQPVDGNPNLKAPAYFEWVARPYGFFNVTSNATVFNFTVGSVTFAGSFGGPVLWDSTGQGPEGWLTNLPFLPIHWFVYSLGSPGNYTWTNSTSGLVLSGKAHAHQEKNWGQGFPAAWMWTQAYNDTSNTMFAGTFGEVSFFDLPSTIPAHLFGYRNLARNISLDFRPDNSYVSKDPRPCDGRARVTITSPLHTVEMTMTTPITTLQKCLRGPVETGFRYNLVETYVATVRVVIKKRRIWGSTVIEDQTFFGAAYEFGGNYLCPQNPCTNTR